MWLAADTGGCQEAQVATDCHTFVASPCGLGFLQSGGCSKVYPGFVLIRYSET